MRYLIFIFACTSILILPTRTQAKAICSQNDAIQADAESSLLKNWREAYRSFKRFRACDDGGIGEGYSDSIARLLTKDWAHISELSDLVSHDKDFQRFVLHHIDELMTPEQSRTINKNAGEHCPVSSQPLCRAIKDRLDKVDKDIQAEKAGQSK